MWNGKNDDESLVCPGNTAVIPPGLVHSGAPAGETATYRMIYIESTVVSETASDILEKNGTTPEFEKIVMNNSKLALLFKILYECVNNNSSMLETDSALTSFIGMLITEYGTDKTVSSNITISNPAMGRAAACLSANLNNKISLEEAAAEAGLSKYHFLRSFKHYTGISPHVYRTQKRIEAAKKHILSGMPFSEIALETGFTDQSHFSNQFKNYTGATPNQYFAC